jgi:hypothetical protein
MKTVNMPGFTAEASLPTTDERYQMLGTLDPDASHGRVVPQFCYRDCVGGYCIWRCYGPIYM